MTLSRPAACSCVGTTACWTPRVAQACPPPARLLERSAAGTLERLHCPCCCRQDCERKVAATERPVPPRSSRLSPSTWKPASTNLFDRSQQNALAFSGALIYKRAQYTSATRTKQRCRPAMAERSCGWPEPGRHSATPIPLPFDAPCQRDTPGAAALVPVAYLKTLSPDRPTPSPCSAMTWCSGTDQPASSGALLPISAHRLCPSPRGAGTERG